MEVKKKSKKKVTKKTSKNIKKEIINIKDKKIKLFIFLVCLITLLLVLVGAAYAYYNVAVNTEGGTGTVSGKSDEVGNVSLSGDGGAFHINLKPKEISNILGGAFYGTDSEEGYSLVEDKIEVAKIEATSLPEKVKYICTFDIKVKPKEGDLTGVTGGEVLFSTISVDLNDIETGRLAFSTLTEEKVYHAKTIVYSGDINYLRVSARITSSSTDGNEAWLQKINGSFSVSTDNLKCTAEKDNAIDEVETYTLSGKLVDENGNALTGYASLMSEPRTIILGDDGSFEVENVEAGLHNLYYMGEVNPESLTKEEIKAQAKSETTFRTRIAKLEDKIKLENRINFLNFVLEDSVNILLEVENGTSDKMVATIKNGGSGTFVISPSTGYKLELKSDTCNGSLNSETGVYTVSNVTENKTCKISLVSNGYTITNTAINGTVSSSTLKINVGENKRVTVTPDSGYYLSSVSCTNGYTTNARTGTMASGVQDIDIKNNNKTDDSTCTYNFSKICSYSDGYFWSFSYIGSMQNLRLPCDGEYKLVVYGAEGGGSRLSGNTDSGLGGYGGYSYGTITASSNDIFYVYVGGYGKSSTSGSAAGGWNGGGSGYASSSGEPGNGGGGATDIRINSTSLYSRVIVAGGGGGGEDSVDPYGHGGGTTGVNGTTRDAYNGTQTSAGTGGGFGYGGATNKADGGGGGGGWFGGGTTSSDTVGDDSQGGGGGSGYVNSSVCTNGTTSTQKERSIDDGYVKIIFQ